MKFIVSLCESGPRIFGLGWLILAEVLAKKFRIEKEEKNPLQRALSVGQISHNFLLFLRQI